MNSGSGAEVLAELLAFVGQTTDFVGVSDPWGRILYLNPAAKKRLGVEDTTGMTLADIFPAEAFGFYYDVVRPQLLRTGSWSGEVLVNAAGSGAVPMYVSTIAQLGPGGETNGGVVYAHEIARVAPATVAHEADVDEGTGLLSRQSFEAHASLALAEARRDGEVCALLLVDVGAAPDTLEVLGELVVASVMRAIGGRILRLARTVDVAGRVGEHQLGLLLRGVRSRIEVLRIARMVQEALVERPVATAAGEVIVSVDCSVVFNEAGDEPASMLERAAATMTHEGPAEPKGRESGGSRSRRTEPSITLDDFYVAMSHGHVVPYAQRVVDLGSQVAAGYCGFARWQHQHLGLLDAGAFVDLIAETPLANELDLYVARETAAVLLLTARGAPQHLYSPASQRLISDVRTEQYLSEIADAFCLSMHQINLLVARRFLEESTPAFRDALQSLCDADVSLVLSGIEHESDAGLWEPNGFRELRISRRLTDAVVSDAAGRRVVTGIARAAHDGGLRVAASGVNDRAHEAVLIECGCDLATGDLYGAPEPANTIDGPES